MQGRFDLGIQFFLDGGSPPLTFFGKAGREKKVESLW